MSCAGGLELVFYQHRLLTHFEVFLTESLKTDVTLKTLCFGLLFFISKKIGSTEAKDLNLVTPEKPFNPSFR